MGFINRYDAKTYIQLGSVQSSHEFIILTMCYVNNELWCAGSNTTISIIDGANGTLKKILEGHMGRIYSLVKVGNYVWSCSFDKHILIWNATDYTCCNIINGYHKDSITCMIPIISKGKKPKIQLWTGTASADGQIYILTASASMDPSLTPDNPALTRENSVANRNSLPM